MLRTLAGAPTEAIQEWDRARGANCPSIAETRPIGLDAITQLACNRFAQRCDALGLSAQMALGAVESGRKSLVRIDGFLESPIERALAPWLIFEDCGTGFMTVPAKVHIPNEDIELDSRDVFVIPQLRFARYRLDVAVVGRTMKRRHIVAVECDGTEYHDPIADVVRDTHLASWGIATVRASGEEICTNPLGVNWPGRRASALHR